jgi:hypothetical protein
VTSRTVLALLTALTLAGPSRLLAQSSQFGARALGLPVLAQSVRGQGTGGGLAMFDAEGSLNPASFGGIRITTASFNIRQYWRTSENPFGTARGNDTQFPLAIVAAPVGRRWSIAVSVSALLDRTFALATVDTVVIRDEPVEVNDTLTSRGGISDARVAVAYRVSNRVVAGLGVHLLTGVNRLEYRRSFADSNYASVRLRNELSTAAPGVSFGVIAEPTANLRLSGLLRFDADLRINLDSTRIANQSMPMTLAGGASWSPSRRLMLAGHVLHRNWSVADEEIRERGGPGAVNTLEAAGGVEWVRSRTNPFRLPIRAGLRFAELPFPVAEGRNPHELSASLGTGLRFSGGRGSLDLAIERAWRSDGGAYRERSFLFAVGIGIRP